MFFKKFKIINNFNNMNKEEAKDFFFTYIGNSFYMDREEPEKAKRFHSIRLSNSLKRKWYQELLDRYYEKAITCKNKDQSHVYIENYMAILTNLKRNINKYIDELLSLLDYSISNLDSKHKIVIMESLAGRTSYYKIDGIYFFIIRNANIQTKRKTKQVLKRLVDIDIDNLMDIDNLDLKNRYNEALKKLDL